MAALPAMIASSEGSTTYRKDLLTSAEIAGKLMREGRDEDLAIYRDSPDLQTPSSEIAGSRFGEFRRISPVYIRQISPDLVSADFAGSRFGKFRRISPDLASADFARSHFGRFRRISSNLSNLTSADVAGSHKNFLRGSISLLLAGERWAGRVVRGKKGVGVCL